MKIKIPFTVILLLLCSVGFAQEVDFTPQDKEIFDKYIGYIEPYKTGSKEQVLQKTAEFFLGTPYVASTLEKNQTEKLIINLRQLDCVTYVENVLALTQIVTTNRLTFEDFSVRLRNIRYRNGFVNGYDSRLHYTSDWAYDNRQKKNIQIETHCYGGQLERKTIDFMSSHRDSYRQLKSDNAMLEKIKQMESEVNKRGGFYFLPTSEISKKASQIPHMAVIAFTTSIEGLDTTHMGFTFRRNGKLTFIHASSALNKVVVDEKSLSDYCASQKSCTGIMLMKVL